jgi:hypothetical protein
MRGVKEPAGTPVLTARPATPGLEENLELAATLRDVARELREVRLLLESRAARERNSNDV